MLLLVTLMIGKFNNKKPDQQVVPNPYPPQETPKRDIASTSVEGFAISSPSDPAASYRILQSRRMKNGNLEVLSQRDGRSGRSFARREISCSTYEYRYLGEGDTRKEALQAGANIGEMSALTGTSASSDVANAACTKSHAPRS